MIINPNHFLQKKDCITYILFFTFAAMKKNQYRRIHSSNENKSSHFFLRILKNRYSIKDNFSFGIDSFLETESLHFEIIYANIRV